MGLIETREQTTSIFLQTFHAKARKRSNFELADKLSSMVFLPGLTPVASTVIATARFCVQGPDSVGTMGNWSRWIRTRFQSYGYMPPKGTWQKLRGWISGDSIECAHCILDPFDLSIDDVYAAFGKPQRGKLYIVDLIDIVKRLCPDMLETEACA